MSLKSTLQALLTGAGLLLALAPAQAAAPVESSLVFCNKSSGAVEIALVYLEPKTSKWTLAAWRTAAAGSCLQAGKYRAGKVYYYAEKAGGQVHWPAKSAVEKTFCVPKTKIERTVLGDTCAQGERTVGFQGIDVKGATFTFNLTGN
jgi:Protein of unknown function (DUF1036)